MTVYRGVGVTNNLLHHSLPSTGSADNRRRRLLKTQPSLSALLQQLPDDALVPVAPAQHSTTQTITTPFAYCRTHTHPLARSPLHSPAKAPGCWWHVPGNVQRGVPGSIDHTPSHLTSPIHQQQLQQLPATLAGSNVQHCLAVSVLSSQKARHS